jgi:hypothetical protein
MKETILRASSKEITPMAGIALPQNKVDRNGGFLFLLFYFYLFL